MANDRRVGNLLVQMRAEIGGLKTDIKELDNAFKTGFTGIQKSAATAFKAVGTSIAAAFSVSAIIGFGKSVVDLAGRLQDLSDQTGISAQLLSGMKSTLEESGTSLDAFAKGIFTAQKNLGQIDSDTDKAAVAIKQLGLNLNELRNATPERFLELVAQALAKIDNPVQKAALGFAVLGKSFQELAPGLAALAGGLEEFRRQGISEADIKRLEEFGDSLTRLSNIMQIMAAGPLTNFINNITGLATAIGLLEKTPAGIFTGLEASVRNLSQATARALGVDLGKVAAATREELEALAKASNSASVRAAITSLLEARRQMQAFLNATPGGIGSSATAPAKLPTTPFVAPPGKTTVVKSEKDAAKETRIELEHLRDGFSELEESAFKASQAMIPVFKELRDLGLTAVERDLAAINDRFDALAVTIKQFGEATRQDIKPFLEDLEFLRSQELLKLEPDADLWDLPERMAEEAKKSKTAWEDLFSGVGSGLQSTLNGIIQGTQTWGETWRTMLANIATSAAHALGSSLIKGLADTGAGDSGWLGGLLKTAGSALSAFFGSGGSVAQIATAGGGIFRAPTLRMIGEAGPEAVVPLPRMQGMMGGKPKVTVNILGSVIPNPGVSHDQVIQIGIEQFNNRGAWTQTYENRRSRD